MAPRVRRSVRAGAARGVPGYRNRTGRHARIPHAGRLVSRHPGDGRAPRGRGLRGHGPDDRPGRPDAEPARRSRRRRRARRRGVGAGRSGGRRPWHRRVVRGAAGERHLGFGERSNAVDQRGLEVENYVAEGPYQAVERPFIAGFVPPAGYHPRDDATYFPIPWLLSTPRHRCARHERRDERLPARPPTKPTPGPWRQPRRRLGLRVVAGPEPAAVVRRFSELVGRQPPIEAPFFLGPWWQPKGDEASNIATLKAAGAIGSVVQTYTHYLPCGDQVEQSERDADRALPRRRARRHDLLQPDGLHAVHGGIRGGAAARRAHPQRARRAVRVPLHGLVAVLRRAGRLHASGRRSTTSATCSTKRSATATTAGWRTSASTRRSTRTATTGPPARRTTTNTWSAITLPRARTLATARRARWRASTAPGWTGAARHSQIVWGGDPSTELGLRRPRVRDHERPHDGALRGQPLGLGHRRLLRPVRAADDARAACALDRVRFRVGRHAHAGERLRSCTSQTRAQIFDADLLPIWARYAKLRTQLYPYLSAAQSEYDRSGMPLMRHLALAFPDDPLATARADEYMLGSDLLVAPVIRPDERERTLYLPAGRWIDWWRSITLDARGAPHLGAPRVLSGARDVTLPAPLEELPLLVRRGRRDPAARPVRRDARRLRRGRRGAPARSHRAHAAARLAARPAHRVARGRPGLSGEETVTSEETSGGWELNIQGHRMRRYDVEAALGSLSSGAFEPCRVSIGQTRPRVGPALALRPHDRCPQPACGSLAPRAWSCAGAEQRPRSIPQAQESA